MTAVASIAVQANNSPVNRVAAFFNGCMTSAANWAARRAKAAEVAKELESYTDRELTDLGISRHEIPRIAAEAGAQR